MEHVEFETLLPIASVDAEGFESPETRVRVNATCRWSGPELVPDELDAEELDVRAPRRWTALGLSEILPEARFGALVQEISDRVLGRDLAGDWLGRSRRAGAGVPA